MEYWKLRDKYVHITGIRSPKRPTFTGEHKRVAIEAAGAMLTAARKIEKDLPISIEVSIEDYSGEVKIIIMSKDFARQDAEYDAAYTKWARDADQWVKDNLDPETGERLTREEPDEIIVGS